MEDVISTGQKLLNRWTTQPARKFSELKYCKTTRYGDVWVPKEGSDDVLKTINDKGLTLDTLSKELAGSTFYPDHFFSKLTLDRHNHLCLSLNRPIVFAMAIRDITTLKERYATHQDQGSVNRQHITLMNHVAPMACHRQSSTDTTHVASNDLTRPLSVRDISLSEARSELIMRLLANLLQSVGCLVHVPNSFTTIGETEASCSVGNIFNSFFTENSLQTTSLQKYTPAGDIDPETFISSFLPSRSEPVTSPSINPNITELVSSPEYKTTSHNSPQICTTSTSSSLYPPTTTAIGEAQRQILVCTYSNVLADAKAFAVEHKLLGKGGYEKNLNKIQVTDAEGRLTPVAKVAHDICNLNLPVVDHVIIHIAKQQRNYHTQQAMILADMFNRKNNRATLQHISLTSGVDCLCCPQSTRERSIADLFQVRLKQMSGAYVVKYGEKAKGAQLQEIAKRMTEAVVKFELLSHDPTSTIKIDLPDLSTLHDDSHMETDVRFAGAFVLYNYARLATLINHHKQACDKGDYPPLPSVDEIDFSLLKEEEEWQLLFHYLLQYPLVVKEASQLSSKGVGIHLNISLKKVCQFLVKLCHCFSSYYSRTKVLMPPEPNLLPLVHARLYLVMSIKQVMYNALTLLAIEPLEEL